MAIKATLLHLRYVKAALKSGQEVVYLHGDGNMYANDSKDSDGNAISRSSNFRKAFSSPQTPECEMRLAFTKESVFPTTQEELETAFYTQQMTDSRKPKVEKAKDLFLSVSLDDEDEIVAKKSKK